MTANDLLAHLAIAERVEERVAIVAAHPDDETLGLGARMATLRRLTLIHVTDGSPRDRSDAQRAGLATREAYAAARRRELANALEAAGAQPERVVVYDVADQEAVLNLASLIERLTADLAGMAAVVTHPYEGGHPDHDATALAVSTACRHLGEAAPVRLEFAGYHLGEAGPVTAAFHGDPGVECAAGDADRARKRAALAAFTTQQDTLALFREAPERLRLAPAYDFAASPPVPRVLYDRYKWPMTSALWREHAASLEPPAP